MKFHARLGALIMRVRPAPLAVLLKTLLRIRRVEHRTTEGTFWVDPASYQGITLLRRDVYEPEMLALIKSRLARGDVFVDVGANEGYFSVVGSRAVGPHGRVVAIEPQARVEPVIRRNLALNGCDNVTLVRAAISDRPGTAMLHLTPGVNNSASSLMQPTRYPLRREQVELATLEQIWRDAHLTRCALMKIDIEGWEHEAILGNPTLFREQRVDALALELHPHLLAARGLSATAIVEFLDECGYRQVEDRPELFLPTSTRMPVAR